MLGICTSIPHMLHTLRCTMAAVFCIFTLSHLLCSLVVLPSLLLVRVYVCLLSSSVCLLSYLLLLTVGAHPVVPDPSRLCSESLLRYQVKLNVATLQLCFLTCWIVGSRPVLGQKCNGVAYKLLELLTFNISLSLSLSPLFFLVFR